MKFIREDEFLQSIPSIGLQLVDDPGAMEYIDEQAVLGFDFTNLTPPDMSTGPYETVAGGDRSVEYAMVSTLFKIVESLGLFPVHLFAVDNEWADEDLHELATKGFITQQEEELLGEIVDGGHGMEVIVLDQNELSDAARIVTPQITTFSTRCQAVDTEARFLAEFSPDDEVSFNTTDKSLYNKVREMVLSLKNLPFEVFG